MGDYITNADLKARFPDDAAVSHLTDTADTGVPDEDVLTEIINGAERLMDSYIGKRYSIPVAVTTGDNLDDYLSSMALDISEVMLIDRSGQTPAAKQRQMDRRMTQLRDLAKGVALLPDTTEAPSTTARGTTVSWGSGDAEVGEDTSEREFTRSSQSGL